MINRSELRFGSFVTYNPEHKNFDKGTQKKPFQVECIDHERGVTLNDGFNNWYYYDEILPIDLSPEILEKCGFNYDKKNDNYIFKNYYYVLEEHTFWLYRADLKTTDMHKKCVLLSHIKNLHQLQNLIFILSGEELNINLLT